MTRNPPTRPTTRTNLYRLVRQLHLWIGAWGAIAAILYGVTGLVMNHRFGENAWSQGDSIEADRQSLAVPVEARATPEQLSLWLREARALDAQVIRKSPPGGEQPPRWSLGGGDARRSWSLDYLPGAPEASLRFTEHSPLAAFNRLHKGVGGGLGWTVLADSFALAMILLGLSGIVLWARGRRLRDWVLSVFAVSAAVLALVLGPALA